MIVDDKGNAVDLGSATVKLNVSDEALSGLADTVTSKLELGLGLGSVASTMLADTVKKPWLGIGFENTASNIVADAVKKPWLGIGFENTASNIVADMLSLKTLDLGIGSTFVAEQVDRLLGFSTLDIESPEAASPDLLDRERDNLGGNQPESIDLHERRYALTMIAIATMIAAVGCVFATQRNDPQGAMELALGWLAYVCWIINKT